MASCTKFWGKKLLKLYKMTNSLRGGSPRSDKKGGEISPPLSFSPTARPTEQQIADKVETEHDAHADPVAECRSTESANRNPVPQEHKNPTLEAEHTEHNGECQYEDKDEGECAEQTTAILVQIYNLVFHFDYLTFCFIVLLKHLYYIT